jgi:hypothetical protein
VESTVIKTLIKPTVYMVMSLQKKTPYTKGNIELAKNATG